MARLRGQGVRGPSSGVPVELLDHDHEVWRAPDLWVRWCRRHLSGTPLVPRDAWWFHRFGRAVHAWAADCGFDKGDGKWPFFPDWNRLQLLGIKPVSSLERARALEAR